VVLHHHALVAQQVKHVLLPVEGAEVEVLVGVEVLLELLVVVPQPSVEVSMVQTTHQHCVLYE
jgi:hypothetical protein